MWLIYKFQNRPIIDGASYITENSKTKKNFLLIIWCFEGLQGWKMWHKSGFKKNWDVAADHLFFVWRGWTGHKGISRILTDKKVNPAKGSQVKSRKSIERTKDGAKWCLFPQFGCKINRCHRFHLTATPLGSQDWSIPVLKGEKTLAFLIIPWSQASLSLWTPPQLH